MEARERHGWALATIGLVVLCPLLIRNQRPEAEMLRIVKPGARVQVNGLDAFVLQASIGMNEAVQYQVTWWDGKVRRTEWVDASEVVQPNGNGGKLAIGFKPPNGDTAPAKEGN